MRGNALPLGLMDPSDEVGAGIRPNRLFHIPIKTRRFLTMRADRSCFKAVVRASVVRVHEIYVRNLFSFAESSVVLNQTNVVVGPNNAGKTNILRVLKMMTTHLPVSGISADRQTVNRASDDPPAVGLDLEVTAEELAPLLEAIFPGRDVGGADERLRRFRLVLGLGDIKGRDEMRVVDMAIRFENGMTVTTLDRPYSRISDMGNDRDLAVFATQDRGWRSLLDMPPSSKNDEWDAPDEALAASICSGKGFADLSGGKRYHLTEEFTSGNNTEGRAGGGRGAFHPSADDLVPLGRSFWGVVSDVIYDGITVITGERLAIQDLAGRIHAWRDTHDAEYVMMRDDFSRLFPKTTFCLEKHAQKNARITISEDGRDAPIPLDQAASGHAACVFLLFSIYDGESGVVFFDEPETHFHPAMMSVLSEMLPRLARNSTSQLTFVTHSPALVNTSLLRDGRTDVIYVRRDGGYSKVHRPDTGDLAKSVRVCPDVFFGSACLLVEGPSDEYAARAISDSYGRALERASVHLFSVGGVKSIDPLMDLLGVYGIPSVAMADREYSGSNPAVVMLDGNLEGELGRLGWGKRGGKARPEEAYSFITSMLQDKGRRRRFEGSLMYKVIRDAIKASGKDPEKYLVWRA